MHVSSSDWRSLTYVDTAKAFTEMTRQIRNGKGKTGLVLANGGTVTYQHAVCLSSAPRGDGKTYPPSAPLPSVITDEPVPAFAPAASGEATVEVSSFAG